MSEWVSDNAFVSKGDDIIDCHGNFELADRVAAALNAAELPRYYFFTPIEGK